MATADHKADTDALLRQSDPLYLIPASYQPKKDGDHPPWMTAEHRERKGDFKLWQHKYKFHSHTLAHHRADQRCEFYGGMSGAGAMNIAQQAKAAATVNDPWPHLDKNAFTYEATMERIIGDLHERANKVGHLHKPNWEKYKFFSGGGPGRERIEADYHKQEQDHLHTFKKIDMPTPQLNTTFKVDSQGKPLPTQRLPGLNASSSSTDVVEQATQKLELKTRRIPQKSQSVGAMDSEAAVMEAKRKMRERKANQ